MSISKITNHLIFKEKSSQTNTNRSNKFMSIEDQRKNELMTSQANSPHNLIDLFSPFGIKTPKRGQEHDYSSSSH